MKKWYDVNDDVDDANGNASMQWKNDTMSTMMSMTLMEMRRWWKKWYDVDDDVGHDVDYDVDLDDANGNATMMIMMNDDEKIRKYSNQKV